MTRLTQAEILFFEPADTKPDDKGRKVRPNITVYQLPRKITLASNLTPVVKYSRRRTTACIEQAMRRHHFREPLLWCTSPEQVHQLDYLAYRGLVYDCHRYWSDLPIDWEGELAAAADICFAASEGLVDRLSPCNENIALLPNGVNYPLFRREVVDVPPELTGLSGRPVLGYVGTLHPDLDVSPILLCAQKHPNWIFLLIGPTEPSPYLSQLVEQENVLLLGKRPLVELPDYLSCCNVCVNLLRAREEDSDVIPARVYEYLSAGKPVVSMLWRHQRQEFPDVVRGARSPEEFVRQCRAALQEDPSDLLRRRRDYGSAAAWDVRVGEVARILDANSLC